RESNRAGGRGVVIYTYMSHHQGMTLLALDNVLHRGAIQRRFHADRRIRAIEPLLFERVPATPLPVEDMRTGRTAPVPVTTTGTSSVRFLADHTEFHRRALDIETVNAITVAAEDDAELRRLTITNWSARTRELEFTSYAELALAPHAADTAHPAFSKMFIQT